MCMLTHAKDSQLMKVRPPIAIFSTKNPKTIDGDGEHFNQLQPQCSVLVEFVVSKNDEGPTEGRRESENHFSPSFCRRNKSM